MKSLFQLAALAIALLLLTSGFGQERPKLPIRMPPPGEGECDADDPANEDKLKLIGPEFNIGPGTLKGAEIPEPSNLGEFVKNKQMAIVLGKSLFWDMQVGSDGIQACATCHFRAGADPRSVNQLAPGGTGTDSFFDVHFQAKTQQAVVNSNALRGIRSFDLKPPNSKLERDDFPLHKLEDPTNRASRVLRDVDDVVSSQGIIRHHFSGVSVGMPTDRGADLSDPVFNVNGKNIRRVEPRNTPSVINAIFNHRNFWDGRAQEIFNGRNIAGVRDEKATVIKALNPRNLTPTKVRIDNASLASLSVGPPLSADEMSYEGRAFYDIGHRLLKCKPLRNQVVLNDDSVLGPFSRSFEAGESSLPGLIDNYEHFVKEAFHEAWWRSDLLIELDVSGNETFVDPISAEPTTNKRYQLIEYNFSLFYGLALQCYMATLVSDDAKIDQHFDRLRAGLPGVLNETELKGMEVFTSEKARCSDCHHGPEFSGPNVRALKRGFWAPDHPKIKPPFTYWQPPEEVERMFIGSCDVALYNQGFYNIGVRPFVEDLGIGGLDAYGNPLSAAEVLANKSRIANQELRDLYVPRLSLTYFPSLASKIDNFLRVPEIMEGERTAVLGAFKMPSLRNVELTAPYFHTGGYLTLRQVVEFYNRGGDFHDWVSADGVAQDRFMDLGIGKLCLTDQEIDRLVEFLKTLTDQRVLTRKAPFDHPQLFVPNGHKISEIRKSPTEVQTVVEDIMVEIPAVGKNGGAAIDGFLDF